MRLRRGARTMPARAKAGGALALQHRVLPHRQVADHAHRVAVFGNARDAGATQARGRAGIARPAASALPAAQREQPAQQRRPAPAGRCRPRRRSRRSRRRAAARSTPSSSRPAIGAPHARRRAARTRSRRGARGRARAASATARPTISSASSALSAPAAGSVATSLPPRSTAMRCDTRSTSSSLWLMKMIDRPSRHQLRAASRTATRSPAASAPRWARRGSGCARRGRAPSGSRRAGARPPTARRCARPGPRPGRSAGRCRRSLRARGGAARERLPQRLGAEHHVVEHASGCRPA